MPEIIGDIRAFTLYEVATSIRKVIGDRYHSKYWVKTEINKLNIYSHTGHAYPELVEKRDGAVIAEMRGVIWRDDLSFIGQKMVSITQEDLRDGIIVLMLVSIQFDQKYGLSLRVHDIDPSFTLGELEREKQETIKKLKSLGLFELNRRLPLPLLPKRIAVISVETSKGYSDWRKMIDGNPFGFLFEYTLFPAILQGEKAVQSILSQLEQIRLQASNFDVVAIIRGGGGDVGLTCYNHFDLASGVAQFPLPVLSGIGHSTNVTATEMVSWKHAITPSELADDFIRMFQRVGDTVANAENLIASFAASLLYHSGKEIDQLALDLKRIAQQLVTLQQGKTSQFALNITQGARALLAREKERHHQSAMRIQRYTPMAVNNHMQMLDTLQDLFIHMIASGLLQQQVALHGLAEKTQRIALPRIKQEHIEIRNTSNRMITGIRNHSTNQKNQLQQFENHVRLVDPMEVLKRGYAYATVEGKAIRSIQQLKTGDEIKTYFFDGFTLSEIKEKGENHG
jgi:exodeoxyribonuclease VII large subunit